MYLNAVKVAYGNGNANLKSAYLIPKVVDGVQRVELDRRENSNIYYNLLGQPVTNPTKGIYIHNGKKVVIK